MDRDRENEMDKEHEVPEIEAEIVEPEKTITTPFRPSDIRLTTPPMNLGDLIDMIREGWVNFSTDYQRAGDLWGPVKQSRLIESVLLGLRLPAFYFEEVSKRQWNIIDGLQRCCAIRRFCVDGSLALSELEFLGNQFNGALFSDLPYETRRDIRMLPITVNVLDKDTPVDVKYILFKRLNTGGVNLTLQEVRSAMFQGRAIDVVKRMAESEAFVTATCGKVSSRRQEDRDFVSRFISFYLQDYRQYHSDLETHINHGMEMLQHKLSSREIEELESAFERSMLLAWKIFGDDAFRKRMSVDAPRHPLNKAYFEALSVGLSRLNKIEAQRIVERGELLKSNLMSLMNEPRFVGSLTGGTGGPDRVQRRFQEVERVLRLTLEGRKETRHAE